MTSNSGGLVLVLDYELDVPSRELSIDWTATFANISETEVAVTLDLAVSGPNGDVRVVGTSGVDGGTFTVKVNGDTFATITFAGSSLTIVSATGDPLTPDEDEALESVFDSYEGLAQRVQRAADAGELRGTRRARLRSRVTLNEVKGACPKHAPFACAQSVTPSSVSRRSQPDQSASPGPGSSEHGRAAPRDAFD